MTLNNIYNKTHTMEDNFDIYEYRDQLRSQQIKETLTGMDASNKVIMYLRDNIYPKLDDKGMDEFVIEMCNHFDVEPPSYRTMDVNEEYTTSIDNQTIKIDDLSFDLLGDKPMFGFSFPNPDDSSTQVFNQKDLERWSSEVKSKYGNVDVSFNDGEIEVMNKQFKKDQDDYIQGKGRALKKMGTNV